MSLKTRSRLASSCAKTVKSAGLLVSAAATTIDPALSARQI